MGDKYKVLTTLGKGELIGEMSFFDKSVRSATVIAKGAGQRPGVHEGELRRHLLGQPHVVARLWSPWPGASAAWWRSWRRSEPAAQIVTILSASTSFTNTFA